MHLFFINICITNDQYDDGDYDDDDDDDDVDALDCYKSSTS